MARRELDPMAAMIREEASRARRGLAKASRAQLLRRIILLTLTSWVLAGVAWWIVSNKDTISHQTPPADCIGRSQDIGCGGVVPATP